MASIVEETKENRLRYGVGYEDSLDSNGYGIGGLKEDGEEEEKK